MSEEVKIVVRQETEGTALRDAQRDAEKLQQTTGKSSAASPPADTQAKIKALRAEAEKLRSDGNRAAKENGFDDLGARSARAQASAREREANRLERPINTAEKSAQKEERDAKAKALREQRTAEQAAITEARASTCAAARESAEEKKKFAAEDKAEKTAAVIAEREQRKAS